MDDQGRGPVQGSLGEHPGDGNEMGDAGIGAQPLEPNGFGVVAVGGHADGGREQDAVRKWRVHGGR